ncbi:MAG: NAD(P)/FAD-dependent oxidoreductase [Nitriliruptoraceae bacterium]|nr:NAD(P)/FAD-dependent oxidoreductase [Nitriliruptoraceae bacterium]
MGAGFAGIAAAIRCAQAGFDDVLVLEAGDGVGGTWRDNTYPGAACDIRTSLYSLSFAPEPGWTRRYPRQPELHAYLDRVARQAGIHHVLRTRTTVTEAVWDDAVRCWQLTTDDGARVEAQVLVLAIGGLRVPAMLEVPGLERFPGPTFHTARYDHGVDLADRRVGVVGTGASAAQLVPAIAGIPRELHVIQRTAPWVIPRNDRPRSPLVRHAARIVPGWRELDRLREYLRNEVRIVGFRHGSRLNAVVATQARRHLDRQVADPQLRAALRPETPLGCKRVVISDDLYPALTRPDVYLHPQAVVAGHRDGVELADGTRLDLDVLIQATGFAIDAAYVPMRIVGRDGATLGEPAGPRPRTWLGITHPGFPNLFQLLGPNSALGHNSVLVMIEAQVAHLTAALEHLRATGRRTIEVRARTADAYLAEVDARHAGSVWAGCRSWYVDDDGRNVALWPGSSLTYRHRARRLDERDYLVA